MYFFIFPIWSVHLCYSYTLLLHYITEGVYWAISEDERRASITLLTAINQILDATHKIGAKDSLMTESFTDCEPSS